MTHGTSTASPAAGERRAVPGSTGGQVSRWLRVFAWISFVLNVVIIATGGAVRLTGSGLGCSEWPLCTPDSLVPTDDLGIHGIIEFGNRTISGPLLLAALVVLILTWRIRRDRRDLFAFSITILALVVLQAFVGAFVVWEELAAVLVGFHYSVSVVIVCIAAAYLVRMREAPGPRERVVPGAFAGVAHLTTLALAVTVFVGVLTTGAGPHSGDENVIRDGFDATLLAHLHSWPGYILLALVIVLTVWAAIRRLRPLAWLIVLLLALAVQVAVGVYQSRTGLPVVAVGVHMVLAALTSAAMTVVILRLKRPIAES